MAERERLICASQALADSGRGVRFEVEYFGERAPAFAVRCAGEVHAYLNRCAHVAMELDWRKGYFSIPTDAICYARLTVRRTTRAAAAAWAALAAAGRW